MAGHTVHRKHDEIGYDVFGIRLDDDHYIITKNGDFFLNCCGSERDAQAIADALNADAKKSMEDVKT